MTDVPDLLRSVARAIGRHDSKPWQEIFEDLKRYTTENHRFPTHYFTRELYHRDVPNPNDYLDAATVDRVAKARRAQPARWLFDDKYHFIRHLSRNGIRVPRLFGYSIGGYFYDEEERIPIGDLSSFRAQVERLLAESGCIFLKDLGGRMGQRIIRLTPESPGDQLAEAFRESQKTALIYEEEQPQHPAVAAAYSHSLNTLRIINCMLGPDEVATVSALMRVGAGGGYVDNSSQGGLFVGIDLDTGKLRRQARRFFNQGGGLFETHPETGFRFEGFEVPFFKEALDLAAAAMRSIPSPLIGWDVGIRPDGPVVIEGNAWADLFGAELADGGYRNNLTFQRFLDSLPEEE